MYIASQKASCN